MFVYLIKNEMRIDLDIFIFHHTADGSRDCIISSSRISLIRIHIGIMRRRCLFSASS
jgi:hypothetical protein